MGWFGGEWTPVVTMVLTNMALGFVNALLKKTLDGGINHMVVATYRLAISAVFLAPIAYFWERKTRPRLTFTILCQHFLSALLGASLTQFFLLLGLSYTSATLSCAFLSMIPAITFTLALIFRIEKLNLNSKPGSAKVLGTLICISGALFLTFYKGLPLTNLHSQTEVSSNNINHHHGYVDPKKKAENWVIGCLFLVIGSNFFSSWLLFQAKVNLRYPCQYSGTVLLSIFGTLQCALLSLIKSRDVEAWVVRDKLDIIAIVYAGVVGQGISTVAMSWCIKKRGAVFTSTFTPLMLISAAIFDFAILRRQLHLGSVIGSIITVTGLYIFLWGKNKDTKTKECGTNVSSQVAYDSEENDEIKSETTGKLPV